MCHSCVLTVVELEIKRVYLKGVWFPGGRLLSRDTEAGMGIIMMDHEELYDMLSKRPELALWNNCSPSHCVHDAVPIKFGRILLKTLETGG